MQHPTPKLGNPNLWCVERHRHGSRFSIVEIRDAQEGDWAAIWPFFRDIVTSGESYAYPLDVSAEQARALWMAQPPARTFVALVDGRVVGSATSGSNRPGRGAHVATASFMVDPAHAGRGVGRALAEHVLAWAGAAGFRSMQFNAVVETNTAAVALWHSLGFVTIGTVPGAFDHPEHGYVGLHVMHRTFDSSGQTVTGT